MPVVHWTNTLSCLHPLDSQMDDTLRFERIQLYHACIYTCFAHNWQLKNGNLESVYDQMDVTIQVTAVGELYVFHAFVRLLHAFIHALHECSRYSEVCHFVIHSHWHFISCESFVGPSSSISSTSATTTTVVSSALPNRYSSACMGSLISICSSVYEACEVGSYLCMSNIEAGYVGSKLFHTVFLVTWLRLSYTYFLPSTLVYTLSHCFGAPWHIPYLLRYANSFACVSFWCYIWIC